MEENHKIESGLGKNSEIPAEIKGWNWGAFFLNWVWGIGNSTYIALLMFIPFVNFVIPFVLGAKGNKWAWQNRTWKDVEHFKKTQRKWAISGVLIIAIGFPLLFFSASSALKGEVFEMSLAAINSNTEVIELIGRPIQPGFFVMGSISTSGPDGEASLQYSITGTKGEAEVYVDAYKKFGKWDLNEVIVINEESGQQINVVVPK